LAVAVGGRERSRALKPDRSGEIFDIAGRAGSNSASARHRERIPGRAPIIGPEEAVLIARQLVSWRGIQLYANVDGLRNRVLTRGAQIVREASQIAAERVLVFEIDEGRHGNQTQNADERHDHQQFSETVPTVRMLEPASHE